VISSYKNLFVWQKGMNLCEDVYLVTKAFPSTEIYGLTSQIRRCCVSIPSNIAEGNARGSKSAYKQFLRIAFASAAELETQLMIAQRIGYLKEKDFEGLSKQLEEIIKMLNSLIKSI
jgi:four helix bundle protein